MRKLFFLLCILFLPLIAKDILDILYTITLKNDLSQRTKEENSGISYVFTRMDLDSLQIHSLYDILRLTPLTEKFNRYGIFDPFDPGSLLPFASSYVKIYLDNHELGGVMYGSGLAILGDLDLGFVDHVEVYMQAPSLEVSTEPSIVIIKLYTKRGEREEGVSVVERVGNKSSSLLSFADGKAWQDSSLYLYGSWQKKGFDHIMGLQRDFQRSHMIFSYHRSDQDFVLYASHLSRYGFIGPSLDAKPQDARLHTKFIHMHYKKKFHNVVFALTAESMRNRTHFSESPILTYFNRTPISDFATKSHSFQVTGNLFYKYEKSNHTFLVGTKYKYKHQKYDSGYFNKRALPHRGGPDNQKIWQLYAQESYNLASNSILNAGAAISFVQNESNIDTYWLRLYRLGHTYLHGNWTFKSNYAHIEYHIDPYLMNSFFVTKQDLSSTRIDNYFENIKYRVSEKEEIEFVGGYLRGKNYAYPDRESKLYTVRHALSTLYLSCSYNWAYRAFSKLSARLFYEKILHIPTIGSYTFKHMIFSNYHSYKNLLFFEELFVRKFGKESLYSDMNVGVKYHALNNLELALRIDNIFDNEYGFAFRRIDPLTFQSLPTLHIPYYNRRVMVSMEWSF